MKITTVQAARKDQGNCEVCREPIRKGDGYRYIKPRYGGKRKRHNSCRSWRPSEMTSGKVATAYAAQEAAHDALDALETPTTTEAAGSYVDDIKTILADCATGGEECRDDYQDGYDNMPENFQAGPTGEEIQEKIDMLESWVSDLEQWDHDDEPPTAEDLDPDDAEDPADALRELLETWAEDAVSSAREAIDALEM